MIISLDYDDTYTRDPEAWDVFIKLFRSRGHKVYIVSWRCNGYEAEPVKVALDAKVDAMYFTGRKAKQKFMFDQGMRIDVWIDDMPMAIMFDDNSRHFI